MNRLRKQILNLLLLVSLVFLCCGRVYGQSPAITAISPSSGPVGMPVTCKWRFHSARGRTLRNRYCGLISFCVSTIDC